jgi:hypothetical protein
MASVVEQLDFRATEFVAQLARLRAGSLPQEELNDSPFRKLLHCVLKAEASAHAAIKRAASSGWEGWCWPRVRDKMDRRYAVVVGAEAESLRAARRANFKATATFPQFLVAETQGLECRATRLRTVRPETVWTCGNWMVRPHPYYCDFEQLARDPLGAKDDARGFELIAWWIHPHFQTGSSRFGQQQQAQALPPVPPMARQESATGDMSVHSTSVMSLPGPYMFGPGSFERPQLDELVKLQAAIREHMSGYYGVDDMGEDDTFFHSIHSRQQVRGDEPYFATAHLHIVHKRPRTVSCFQQAVTLAAVVRSLATTGHPHEDRALQARVRQFRDDSHTTDFGLALSASQRVAASAGGHLVSNTELLRVDK